MFEQQQESKKGPDKYSFGTPGAVAIAINQAGFDWAAGLVLFRIKWRWQMKKKLIRFNKEWVGMSRKDWATESGLTFSVFVNRALPKLRKQPYVDIRSMKLSPEKPKILWVHLDLAELNKATTDPDFDPIQNPNLGGPGFHSEPSYPYKPEQDTYKKKPTKNGLLLLKSKKPISAE